MASTYSDRLRLEKQADGENPNSWGQILNENVIELIDDAIASYTIVSVSSTNVILSEANGTTDQARSAALEFAGALTADITIQIPAEEKLYFVRENTTGSYAVTMKTPSGTALPVTQQSNIYVACDGTNLHAITAPLSVDNFTINELTVVSAATINGSFAAQQVSSTGLTTGVVSATSAVFTGQVSSSGITTGIVSATSGVFSTGITTGVVSATSGVFTGTVSANEVVASIATFGSGITTSIVSATSAIFTGDVSANRVFASVGTFGTGITTSIVSATSAIFTGTVSVNEIYASIGTFSSKINTSIVSATSGIFTGDVSANRVFASVGTFGTGITTSIVSATSAIFTGTVSVNEIDASIGTFVDVSGSSATFATGTFTTGITANVSGTSATFDGTVTASIGSFGTEVITNTVSATTVNLTSLNIIPSGTVMLFQQTAAPTGWTKSTTHNNKALRVVTGTIGTGGTVDFTTAFASQAVAGTNSTSSVTMSGSTAASNVTLPAHTHALLDTPYTGYDPENYNFIDVGVFPNGEYTNLSDTPSYRTTNSPLGDNLVQSSGSGTGSHSHTSGTLSGTAAAQTFTGTSIDLAVQYVDIIIATKD